jgi:hypothetical protein
VAGRKRRRPTPRGAPAAPAASAKARAARWRLPPLAKLLLAFAAVIVLCVWLRWEAPFPWSYDEYYHLGLAREMRSHLRIESFRWASFSTLSDQFVDSTPLFHLLLMPIATLPLPVAGALGALLGQLFAVGAFAWALWSLQVPRPWWFVLALPAVGTMLLQRLEMCRPHVWLIGFSVLVVAVLVERRWKMLLLVCGLFALTHTAGWIAVPIAILWSLCGFVVPDPAARGVAAREGERVAWRPVAAAGGGWLLAQLVHPEVPANFRLFAITNFVIPFQATSAGDVGLKGQLGVELLPPEGWILLGQWPAYVVALLLVVALLFRPRLRTRATLTATLPALAFLTVGSLMVRRFLELGEPLALFALALVVREWARQGVPALSRTTRLALAVLTALGVLATVGSLRSLGSGLASPPLAMARWLGEHGHDGERVFTAQWADSSPLFYAAPQLQSLVVLDPTIFFIKDPGRFARYVTVTRGNDLDPARTIRETFGARWVTIWRMPVFQQMALQLWESPGVTKAYADRDYLVLDLGPPSR